MDDICQSYVGQYPAGHRVCRDGFIQSAACKPSKCSCGRWGRAVPNCCKDELPAHFINDDGSPKFYAQAALSKAEGGEGQDV